MAKFLQRDRSKVPRRCSSVESVCLQKVLLRICGSTSSKKSTGFRHSACYQMSTNCRTWACLVRFSFRSAYLAKLQTRSTLRLGTDFFLVQTAYTPWRGAESYVRTLLWRAWLHSSQQLESAHTSPQDLDALGPWLMQGSLDGDQNSDGNHSGGWRLVL